MRRVLILIAVAFLIVASVSIYYLRKHWCSEISVNRVMLGDENLSTSKVYQCKDSSLVLWLQRGNDELGVLSVNPDLNKVGIVSGSNFFKFQSGVFSWEMPLKPVFLGEIQGKTDDINPRLVIEPNYIEFYPFGKEKKVAISK